MSKKLTSRKISPADKAHLLDQIAALREKESLEKLRELHAAGYDTADLLSCCMEGVRQVGAKFEEGEYYISALIMAGEIMRQAADYLNSYLPKTDESETIGHVLLGTIRGDIHDLGKNILKDMLLCNGFKVTDLGVDVAQETFVEKTIELQPDIVAISCLLTGCLDNLTDAVRQIRTVPTKNDKMIIVGGHCIDELVNDSIKADQWFSDAIEAVHFCLARSSQA